MMDYWLYRTDEDETASDTSRMVYASAEVTAVLADNAQEDYQNAEGRRVGDQELEIRILSGDHKDEIMTVTNYMSALFNVDVDQGDRIIVRIMTDEEGSYYASVFNYDRGIVLGVFLLIFFALLAVLGGKKGVGALAGLLLTLGCIWFILIPCLIRGVPAVPVTIGVSAVAAAAGLIFLNGYSKKTLCAVCGCVGGVLTVENPYVARAKLKRIRKYRPVSCNHIDGEDLSAFFWDEAVEYEPVLELDADFRTAMEKMKTMREIEARLYGMDCGSCGAPSCKALAEDIVRGFATEEACIFKLREEIDGMAESLRRLSRVMPKADGDKSR